MVAAYGGMLVDATFSEGHGVHLDSEIVLDAAAIHTGEFPVGALVEDESLIGHQLALENNFGVRRHLDVDCLAAHHPGAMAIECAEDLKVVGLRRYSRKCGNMLECWAADDNSQLQILSSLLSGNRIQSSPVRGARHVKALLVPGAEHTSIDSPVGHPGVRILA